MWALFNRLERSAYGQMLEGLSSLVAENFSRKKLYILGKVKPTESMLGLVRDKRRTTVMFGN